MGLRCAIIGSGNIGTDLMMKIRRSDQLDLAALIGIDPASDGLARARGLGVEASPDGELLPADEWERRSGQWLPTDVDKTHVRSLMQPVHERGKIAAWIAPPRNGINGQPFDYDYVHLA